MQVTQLPLFCALVLLSFISNEAVAQRIKLHEFVTETARFYDNQPVSDGNSLFGVRHDGHLEGKGAIFKMAMDGSAYQVLFTFSDRLNGYNPVGTLVLSGTTLYGMTLFGGTNDVGVIYAIETDGTGFRKLLDFDLSNGALPYSSLMLSGSVLYGTAQGGSHQMGVLFRISIDGTDYKKLLDFNGSNGHHPMGTMVSSGSTLFGVTNRGGTYDGGIIYSIGMDGTSFKVLYNLRESTGHNPFGGLTLSGTTLYGTTGQGGSSSGFGSVFSINTDGTGFQQFLSFDGTNPTGSLTIIDNMIYGMTTNGGYSSGVVFRINMNDDTYTVLHYFDIINGRNPSGSLLLANNRLYGYVPGGSHGYGIMFRLEPDGNNFTVLKDFEATNTGFDARGGLVFTPVRAYGVTTNGGAYNKGVIYSMNHDGSDYQVIVNFDGSNGAHPEASLLMSGDAFYGVTLFGGTDNNGVLFKVDTTGQNFSVLYNFSYSAGNFPAGALVDSGKGFLYGGAAAGGISNEGIIFRFNKETLQFETLLDFSEVDALRPTGTMVLADSTLYGLALGGAGDGVLFALKIDGTNFRKIVDRSSLDAGRYGNSLALADSTIYVSMRQGGIQDVGVLYSVRVDGSNFRKLKDFSYDAGAVPEGALVLADSVVYGMTQMGGVDNTGLAYRINTDGTEYSLLFTFNENNLSSSGRVAGSGFSTAVGSISLYGDVLYASVTSQSGETTRSFIRQYDFSPEKIVTAVAPSKENRYAIFPNPARQYINVNHADNKLLTLLDSSGKKVPIKASVEGSIDISSLPPGVYYIVVDRETLRFVKH